MSASQKTVTKRERASSDSNIQRRTRRKMPLARLRKHPVAVSEGT